MTSAKNIKRKKLKKQSQEVQQEREKRFNDLHRVFAERSERIHTVNQLLKAYTLFQREDEYIVQDGKVNIVDEHTGRVLSAVGVTPTGSTRPLRRKRT